MKISTTWKSKSLFSTSDGSLSTNMDAKPPFGEGTALSPKQLALAAIAGCTGVDVVGLMRKHKQEMSGLRIEADAPVSEGHPAVFKEVVLDFYFEGNVKPEIALESVRLSQTKYCGVSAMMAKACPIRYTVHLNGETIGNGIANFDQ